MNGRTYRKLTGYEIETLIQNNCHCTEWDGVEVAEGFTPELIRNCVFRGTVRLGKNVHIDGIREKIANYIIEDNVVIRNCESLVTAQASTFGNGVRVAVLIETGGREVPIYNGLTAQTAYLAAMFRHRKEVTRAIELLVDNYAESVSSPLGRIGKGTIINDCGPLTDVCTGEYALIRGASELTNGTVNSTRKSPTLIGRDVIARNFIIADSAEVTDVAFIEKCFVGQGCKIGKGFTAVDTLFFANCDCQQGEACSVFAGPFTTTHHKSTLLISGMFSFFNAGSGSNQSNHMYRLGPMHQGVLERGCKTGSSSYLLFPARIGAFSVVNGRHYSHADTSALPFSRLLDDGKTTVVYPGIMLKSIGTARDANKWQRRDRRKGEKKDRIHFGMLTPYTVGALRRGIRVLEELEKTGGIEYCRTQIPPRGIECGLQMYRLALDLFIGETLAGLLEETEGILPRNRGNAYEKWNDLCGLIAPAEEITALLDRIPTLKEIAELDSAFAVMDTRHEEWSRDYMIHLLTERYEKPLERLTYRDCVRSLQAWIDAMDEQERLLAADAAKEYADNMRIGYGLNGDETDGDAEFAAIQGEPEENPFLENLRQLTRIKKDRANRLIGRLEEMIGIGE